MIYDGTEEHYLFVYDSHVRNNKSITAVQRELRRHFNSHRNQAVPTRTNNLALRVALTRGLCGAKIGADLGRCQTSFDAKAKSFCSEGHSNELGIVHRSVRRFLHFRPHKFGR